ncbi:hypothetical protein A3F06_00475 [candidate division TM6 bacterium RIFCSPHIGHO2_12_FULL_36_22]|nr:MAG: hypothetical protein A3F06_00475 [candidate division TM6 bacterium RIFCSPHIGHO2_12_FULL_36_22]
MKKLIFLPITLIALFSLNSAYGLAQEENLDSEITVDSTLLDIRQAIENNKQLIDKVIHNQTILNKHLIELKQETREKFLEIHRSLRMLHPGRSII